VATYQGLRTLIGQTLASNWTYTPIQVPNTEFAPPAPSGDKENNPSSFLDFEIQFATSTLITMGGLTEETGFVHLYVYLEKDAGDKLINTYMEALRTIFKGADTEDVFFLAADPGAAEFVVPDNPAWVGRIISIPFISFHN
jgi:hypothetical protein